jgi:hypothetical protein
MRIAGVPGTGWDALFHQLAFPTSAWDFSPWVRSLHGREATSSWKIAEAVLTSAFVDEQLPPNITSIPDVLRGNDAQIAIVASPLTPGGRPSRNAASQQSLQLSRGQTIAQNVGNRRHLRMTGTSNNIGTVGVFDRQSPPGRPVKYRLDRGIILNTNDHANPLLLDFHMQNYGGIESTAQLDVSWT